MEAWLSERLDAESVRARKERRILRDVRSPFRSEWRRRSYYDSDVELLDEDTYPLSARTWRRVSATRRTVRQGWRGFTYHASGNAVGTIVAVAVVYLVSR